MAGKKRKNPRKTNRPAFNKTDSQLPRIAVQPNPDPGKAPYLPRIIWDCGGKTPFGVEKRLEALLRFLPPLDLRKLYAVRVVGDRAIQVPGGHTSGCYWPNEKTGRPEIWITRNRLQPPWWYRAALWVFGGQSALNTLYHEVGHHVAHKTPGVSKYKGEAFAERYKDGYKNAWVQARPMARARGRAARGLVHGIIPVMNLLTLGRVPAIRLLHGRATGQISREEFDRQNQALFGLPQEGAKKTKWRHPLEKPKYRDRFQVGQR